MEGQFAIAAELRLASFSLELVAQESSGPFQRIHRVDHPSLVYLPPSPVPAALGCFGDPESHRSFQPFGAAVMVPPHMPLHVISAGFPERRMVICRFNDRRFTALTGLSRRSSGHELAACADVRAAAILDVLERLSVEVDRPAVARETVIAGLGLLLLGELARHFDQVRQNGSQRAGMLAQWQLKRIEDRLADESKPPPTIAELAAACGIGRRHLMRAFKATTGETVMVHADRTLFVRAARLLAETPTPLKTLAASLGYERQGSFSAAFRRRFGETPREFRARRTGERVILR